MGKKLFIFLSIFFIGLFFIINQQYSVSPEKIQKSFSYSPCNTPIGYKIGSIDPKFNLTEDKLLTHIEKAAGIWNEASEKEIFVYNPQGSLTINLVFDERQQLNNKINTLEDQLKPTKNDLDAQIAQYEKDLANFKVKIEKLNAEIDSWNDKGGAPPDEYKRLKEDQERLSAEADRLNNVAKSLNISTDTYNSRVNQLNQVVDTFNTAIQNRPEEGIYDPNTDTINIYFNISEKELIHTLAHELGHARGLEHNENKKSIMYSFTSASLNPSDEDLEALEVVCRERTYFDTFFEEVKLRYNYYNEQLN